jgi:hypothetical protein
MSCLRVSPSELILDQTSANLSPIPLSSGEFQLFHLNGVHVIILVHVLAGCAASLILQAMDFLGLAREGTILPDCSLVAVWDDNG